jgi:signal peptidase I
MFSFFLLDDDRLSPMDQPDTRPRLVWRICRWLFRQCENCLALVGVLALIYFLCFDVSVMTSPSMSPTLLGTSWRNGDWILTEKVTYRFRRPARWEIVRIRRDEGPMMMKRVVGLPGESIRIDDDGNVRIDGRPVKPPAGFACPKYIPKGIVGDGQTVECGRGYFVLGDDTKDSEDSRFSGPVPPQGIVGRVWLILAPRSRIGFVGP